MARIPEATLDAIREATDLVDLIGRYVTLKKAGRSHKGLCPFHSEKTPSFSVNGDAGYFYCFGCGVKGNAFTFLIQHDNLTFPEAARALAAQAGIEVPEASEDAAAGLSESLEAANRAAQDYFSRSLSAAAGAGARSYLATRGFDAETSRRFELGFAPDRWDGLLQELRAKQLSLEDAERAGLLKRRRDGGHYDLLRGRITFPIRDARGRIVAFGGRALGADQEPKYLNSPETPLFRKRAAFYGFPDALEAIRKEGRAVVVEGYFDRLALARAEIDASLATCGTALSEDHARNLRRRTREVTLLFDGDAAGQRAALRSMEVLVPAGLRVRAAALPEGCDPDDFLASHGATALRALVDGAPPAMDLAIDRAVASGCATPWEQADAVASVAPLLALVRDPVERGAYVRKLALATSAADAEIEAAVRAVARGDAPEQALAPKLPRLTEPRERCLAEAARIALRFPDHAGPLRSFFAECPPEAPWPSLLEASFAAGTSGDLIAAIEPLPEALQGLMAQLAEEAEALPSDLAERIVADTCGWLRRDFAKREAKATTISMRRGEQDSAAFLREKQRQLEVRRALTGVSELPETDVSRPGHPVTEPLANAYD